MSLAPSSPPHKRQRLSSPTYEDQLGDLTQEDLAAFDAIEARISQATFNNNKKSSADQGSVPAKARLSWNRSQEEPSSSLAGTGTLQNTSENLRDDPENPFTSGFRSATKVVAPQPQHMGFAVVSALSLPRNADRSPSPEEPLPEPNYDDWFKPIPGNTPVMLGRPAFAKASAMSSFAKASGSAIIMPSEVALANAKAKFSVWDREDAMLGGETGGDTKHHGFASASLVKEPRSPKRPALVSLSSVLNTPGAPSTAPVTATTLNGLPKPQVASLTSQRSTAFKSPLQTRLHPTTHSNLPGSPLNPNRTVSSVGFTAVLANRHPLSATPLTAARLMENTAPNASVGFTTPLRSKPTTSAARTRPGKFHTPFKPNMGPGGPGRHTLPQPGNSTLIITKESTASSVICNSVGAMATSKKKFFSLSKNLHTHRQIVCNIFHSSSTGKTIVGCLWFATTAI